MKKKLLFLLIIYTLISFPFFRNDYIDITHMTYISSLGIEYNEDTHKIEINALLINNYSMGKSEYNTSSDEIIKIVKSKGTTFEDAFYHLINSIHVVIDFSHLDTLIITKQFCKQRLFFELINFLDNNFKFYPSFKVFFTDKKIVEIYNLDYFNDTSSYFTLITNQKSDINYHYTTFIEFVNDILIDNYFCLYPTINIKKNIIGEKIGTSLYLDGYCYISDYNYQHLSFEQYPLLHLLYSTSNINFIIDKKNYNLISYTAKSFKFLDKYYFLYYIKSNYQYKMKDILFKFIETMYKNDIDFFNLKYYNIDINNFYIISVEKNLTS